MFKPELPSLLHLGLLSHQAVEVHRPFFFFSQRNVSSKRGRTCTSMFAGGRVGVPSFKFIDGRVFLPSESNVIGLWLWVLLPGKPPPIFPYQYPSSLPPSLPPSLSLSLPLPRSLSPSVPLSLRPKARAFSGSALKRKLEGPAISKQAGDQMRSQAFGLLVKLTPQSGRDSH